jgi:hypothetical protein
MSVWCHSSGVDLIAEESSGIAIMGRCGRARGAYMKGISMLRRSYWLASDLKRVQELTNDFLFAVRRSRGERAESTNWISILYFTLQCSEGLPGWLALKVGGKGCLALPCVNSLGNSGENVKKAGQMSSATSFFHRVDVSVRNTSEREPASVVV